MNNFIQNETFIKIAMAWEAKFIELIKNYTSDNIDIAFMAEVCQEFVCCFLKLFLLPLWCIKSSKFYKMNSYKKSIFRYICFRFFLQKLFTIYNRIKSIMNYKSILRRQFVVNIAILLVL